jgi:hypothetical protein
VISGCRFIIYTIRTDSADDCWQAPTRQNGSVVADPKRFPSGIKSLAEYVHLKGLKLGLYTAVGSLSCARGIAVGLGCDYDAIPQCDVARQDLDDFVSWDIDHIKVDGCGGFDKAHMNESYAIVGRYLLDAAKRRGKGPVVYNPSCLSFAFPRQFRELASIGNQWRFHNDIGRSKDGLWQSMRRAIEEIGAGQPECMPGPLPDNCTGWGYPPSTWCASFCVERDSFLSIAGPGGWHDPDMLLVGNTPCSDEAKKNGMHCDSLTHDEEQVGCGVQCCRV